MSGSGPTLGQRCKKVKARLMWQTLTVRGVLLCLVACSSPAPVTTPLASDGTNLRDSQGRIALLHGVNARIDGVFDVTFDDGRTALETIPALTTDDCARMRELGFDFLRLPINWSAFETTAGSYDDSYLGRVDAAVQCAAGAGIVVMIDLHQDAYSKEIGEDGAPLWAIQPEPTTLLEGPLDDLGTRRTSAQVTAAFDTFFDRGDPAGIRAAFLDVLDRVAAKWATDPAVIGFEIFNEPPVGDSLVTPFSFEAAQRVRAAAPGKLVMFEPSATRNLFDFAPKSADPFPVRDAVYAPHIYTYVFDADSTQLENATADTLEPSVQGARAEATAWNTPLLIGSTASGRRNRTRIYGWACNRRCTIAISRAMRSGCGKKRAKARGVCSILRVMCGPSGRRWSRGSRACTRRGSPAPSFRTSTTTRLAGCASKRTIRTRHTRSMFPSAARRSRVMTRRTRRRAIRRPGSSRFRAMACWR